MGQFIKTRRKYLGLTQEQVARKLGLSGSYLCLVEYGKKELSVESAGALAKVLELTKEEVLSAFARSGTKIE